MEALKIFNDQKGVRAFFTRKPEDAVGQRPAMIRRAEETGCRFIRPCLVHGKEIAVIDAAFLADKGAYTEIPGTDGLVTDLPGVWLTSTHGDCLPIYLYDPAHGAIGLAHGGWRGVLADIQTELAKTMERVYGSRPEELLAFIGPGIGACHFQVGREVVRAFSEAFPGTEVFGRQDPSEEGKYLLDLKGICRSRLMAAGLRHIEVSRECTVCEKDLYYSYRREGDSLRMLAFMELLRQGGSA